VTISDVSVRIGEFKLSEVTRESRAEVEPSHLVGRERDLRKLLDALDAFAADNPAARIIELTGDPGIGRTAILWEFEKAARARALPVLAGRATRRSSTRPLAAFAEALDERCPASQAWLDTILVTDDQLTGEAAGRGAADFFGREARRLFEHLAGESGLVLILDDVHLADTRSIELLADLLRKPPRAPVLFVLSYRERHPSTPLNVAVGQRSRELAYSHVRLGPLGERDVQLMLAGQGTARLRRELHQASHGNPAYLRALAQERSPTRRYPGWSVPDPGRMSPEHALFRSELDQAEPAVLEVADAAAVVGDQFSAELIATLLDRPTSLVLAAIGELISRDIVRPLVRGQYFTFRHAVVRRALYAGVELSTRFDLHLRADQVLRDHGASSAERARHVEHCAKHGDIEAIDLLAAAAHTIAPTDPYTAAAWLDTALRILPRDQANRPRRAALLVRLAKARAAGGHLRECRDTMHEALRILPSEPRAEHAKAVAFAAMVQRLLGMHSETSAMVRAEVDAMRDDEDSPACAALKFELACGELSNGDSASCRRWAEQALAVGRRHADRSLQAAALGVLAMAEATCGDAGLAGRHATQARGLLDTMLDAEFSASLDAVIWTGWSEIIVERWDDALRHFDRAIDFAARSSQRLALPHLLVGQVFALRNQGRLAEADAAAEHAVYLAEQSGSPEQQVSAYSMRSWTQSILGEPDTALTYGDLATSQSRGGASGWCETLAMRMLAEARLLSGDPEGSLALVARAGGPDLVFADSCSRVAWYELLTRAELAAGSAPESAAVWSALAMSSAAQLDMPGRTGLGLLAAAQVELARDADSALCYAQRAVDSLESSGMVIDALRARLVLGMALAQTGAPDDAMREVKSAHVALEQCGAGALVRAARAERRRLAARMPRRDRAASEGSVAALTRREQQVADLVSQGMTNRRIGRTLHVAEKTVEMHLSNVFAKLGVSSRAAVAGVVTRAMPEVGSGGN
jgi:DNA-binding NarL/FixJ family response regulator